MKNLFKITLPAVLAIIIVFEILFRFVFPASEQPFYFMEKQGDYVIGKYNHYNGATGQYVAGGTGDIKANWNINNHGWNSEADYSFERKDPKAARFAIIGDSFVEALNVDVGKSFSDHLRNDLDDHDGVFSYGIGGAPLSQHLNISRYVNDYYDPDVFIVTVVNNDFEESLRSVGDTRNMLVMKDGNDVFREFPPDYNAISNPPLRRALKVSATIRFLYYNIKLYRFGRSPRGNRNESDQNPPPTTMSYHQNIGRNHTDEMAKISSYVLGSMKEDLEGKRLILLMDAQRKDIFGGSWPDSKKHLLNQMIAEVTDSLEIERIDLTPLFLVKYDQMDERQLKKYNHMLKIDGHWDEEDHRIIADTILHYLSAYPTDPGATAAPDTINLNPGI